MEYMLPYLSSTCLSNVRADVAGWIGNCGTSAEACDLSTRRSVQCPFQQRPSLRPLSVSPKAGFKPNGVVFHS